MAHPTSVAGSASARSCWRCFVGVARRRHRRDADGVVQGLAAPLRDARGRRLPERAASPSSASTATCSPGIEIEGVSLTQGRETIFAAKDVGLRYSLWDLISGGVVIDEIRINEPRSPAEPRPGRLERRRAGQGAGAGGRPRGAGRADHHQPHRHLERHRHHRRAGTGRTASALPKRIERIDLEGVVRLPAGRLRHRSRAPLVPRQRAGARLEQPVGTDRRQPGRCHRRAAGDPDRGERALGAGRGAVVPADADARPGAVVREAHAARVRRLRPGAGRRPRSSRRSRRPRAAGSTRSQAVLACAATPGTLSAKVVADAMGAGTRRARRRPRWASSI